MSFETDRGRFLGRGRATRGRRPRWPPPGPLSNTFGTVIDPVFALRQRVPLVLRLGSVRVAFWTIVAATRDPSCWPQVEARLDPDSYNHRVSTLFWTQAQVPSCAI